MQRASEDAEVKEPTMSGLDNYVDDDAQQQKQTHITFPNPAHPDASANHASEEDMLAHFQSANAIQDSRVNRKAIVGDFLVAVDKAMHEDDKEALEEFFKNITEE
jgi:hypothetical protein